MSTRDYLENTKGTGVLATSDKDGRVNAAIYSRPHFLDDTTVAFIMPDRLTHHNLSENGHAAFLFAEEGSKSKGIRLYLRKLREEKNSPLIEELRRGHHGKEDKDRYLVIFSLEKELPLIVHE